VGCVYLFRRLVPDKTPWWAVAVFVLSWVVVEMLVTLFLRSNRILRHTDPDGLAERSGPAS